MGSFLSTVFRSGNGYATAKEYADPTQSGAGGSSALPSFVGGTASTQAFNMFPDTSPAASSIATGGAGYSFTPNQQSAFTQYKAAGLSDTGALAMVARGSLESGGGTDLNPNAVNSIGAVGIAQDLGSRKDGVIVGDLNNQVQHNISELGTGAGGGQFALDALKSDDPALAAQGASAFERAEGYNSSTHTDILTAKTSALMSKISGGKTSTIGTASNSSVGSGSGGGGGLYNPATTPLAITSTGKATNDTNTDNTKKTNDTNTANTKSITGTATSIYAAAHAALGDTLFRVALVAIGGILLLGGLWIIAAENGKAPPVGATLKGFGKKAAMAAAV